MGLLRKPPSHGFSEEVRISPAIITLVLVALGFLIFIFSNSAGELGERYLTMAQAALVVVLAFGAWRWVKTYPLRAAWADIAILQLVLYFCSGWFGLAGALLVAWIPVAVAGIIISLGAAAGVALFETLAIILCYTLMQDGIPPGWLALGLSSLWALTGLLSIAYAPLIHLGQWSWSYFQNAQTLLEEARDRRQELEQALEDLEDANSQLKRLNLMAQGLRQVADDARTAKEQFVANVSHELRTPLNMITGFSEMILQAPETYGTRLPPSLLADLDVIHRNSEHLAALIDDVLDLSQIEADQMALTKEYVNFGDIVDMATTAVRPLFSSKSLYLKVNQPESMPEVYCDRTRIREVLLNLLSNAGRFTEKGGVTLTVSLRGAEVLVRVQDTGPGIAEDDMPKLFQPFQQVDGTIRRRYGGTGLGLSISKRFIELHDGRISVQSEPGVGTTFEFSLPVRAISVETSDYARWMNPEWEFYQRIRPLAYQTEELQPRFVVLEQDDALRRLLSRYLTGVDIAGATSLESAMCELAQSPAQALLINAPSVTRGLAQLRAASHLPSGIPVIVCSVPDVHRAADTPGVSERLVKPISREVLLSTLHKLRVHRGTVLIVDDEPDALQLFGRMLTSPERAYRILLARDGMEALQSIEDIPPDVILMDLMMPGMDGFELLARLHENPATAGIPVVIISARDPEGQPVISNAVAVTQAGGISVRHLLMMVQVFSQMLGSGGSFGDSGQPEAVDD